MCLALPVKVIQVGLGATGDSALVDLGGVQKEISVELLDDVQVGITSSCTWATRCPGSTPKRPNAR